MKKPRHRWYGRSELYDSRFWVVNTYNKKYKVYYQLFFNQFFRTMTNLISNEAPSANNAFKVMLNANTQTTMKEKIEKLNDNAAHLPFAELENHIEKSGLVEGDVFYVLKRDDHLLYAYSNECSAEGSYNCEWVHSTDKKQSRKTTDWGKVTVVEAKGLLDNTYLTTSFVSFKKEKVKMTQKELDELDMNEDMEFNDYDFSGLDFSNKEICSEFNGCSFENAKFKFARFESSCMYCDFENADFEAATISGDFSECCFRNVNSKNAFLDHLNIEDCW